MTAIELSPGATTWEITNESIQEKSRASVVIATRRFVVDAVWENMKQMYTVFIRRVMSLGQWKRKRFIHVRFVSRRLRGRLRFLPIRKVILLSRDINVQNARKVLRITVYCGITWKPIRRREKPFECDICGQRLKRRGNLKRHILTQHEPEETEECLKTSKEFEYLHPKKTGWSNLRQSSSYLDDIHL